MGIDYNEFWFLYLVSHQSSHVPQESTQTFVTPKTESLDDQIMDEGDVTSEIIL